MLCVSLCLCFVIVDYIQFYFLPKKWSDDGLCQLDGYCHACNTPSGCCVCADGGCSCYDDDDDDDSGCFPATARITLQGGESVSMAELRVGDEVQSGQGVFVSVWFV